MEWGGHKYCYGMVTNIKWGGCQYWNGVGINVGMWWVPILGWGGERDNYTTLRLRYIGKEDMRRDKDLM